MIFEVDRYNIEEVDRLSQLNIWDSLPENIQELLQNLANQVETLNTRVEFLEPQNNELYEALRGFMKLDCYLSIPTTRGKELSGALSKARNALAKVEKT